MWVGPVNGSAPKWVVTLLLLLRGLVSPQA